MSGIHTNHPYWESLSEYSDFKSFCFNLIALQATQGANGQEPNLGTHLSEEALPAQVPDPVREQQGMDGEQAQTRSPSMYIQHNDQPYISMIPTVRALECLAWQLLHGSKTIVFDESRWQECFQAFNTLAMQSTSLITTLTNKYEV